VLSMQLPFAVIPLVRFVSDRGLMGAFTVPRWLGVLSWAIAGLIVVLNGKLLVDTIFG
jgi:manganese transport protein